MNFEKQPVPQRASISNPSQSGIAVSLSAANSPLINIAKSNSAPMSPLILSHSGPSTFSMLASSIGNSTDIVGVNYYERLKQGFLLTLNDGHFHTPKSICNMGELGTAKVHSKFLEWLDPDQNLTSSFLSNISHFNSSIELFKVFFCNNSSSVSIAQFLKNIEVFYQCYSVLAGGNSLNGDVSKKLSINIRYLVLNGADLDFNFSPSELAAIEQIFSPLFQTADFSKLIDLSEVIMGNDPITSRDLISETVSQQSSFKWVNYVNKCINDKNALSK